MAADQPTAQVYRDVVEHRRLEDAADKQVKAWEVRVHAGVDGALDTMTEWVRRKMKHTADLESAIARMQHQQLWPRRGA